MISFGRGKNSEAKAIEEKIAFFEQRLEAWRQQRDQAQQMVDRGRMTRDAGLVERGEKRLKMIGSSMRFTQDMLETLDAAKIRFQAEEEAKVFQETSSQMNLRNAELSSKMDELNQSLHHLGRMFEQDRLKAQDMSDARNPEEEKYDLPKADADRANLDAENERLARELQEKNRKAAKYR